MAARLNALARTIIAPGFAAPPRTSLASLPETGIRAASSTTPTTPTTQLHHQQQVRMASSSSASEPRKFEWLVVVPDKPGAQAKRLEVRPQHFAGLSKAKESGLFKMGGAILEEMPADDEVSSMKFAGSTVMVIAESRQAVIDMLKDDVYVKSGVWDIEKAMIWPAKIAFRYP